MTPTVSIIMNCLNCAKDLPQALESIAQQTYKDWEIIFWDNGSTDNSAIIAKNFGPKLHYFKGEKTVPLGAARNLAISHASGKYIAFLDCDDLWKPEKLAKQIALLERNPKVGLVCTDTEIFNNNSVLKKVFTDSSPAKGMVFDDLMKRQWISMSSAVLRKSALDSLIKSGANPPQWFDERFELCEEADVFYRIAHDWELDYVPEALTLWRVHGNNTTFSKFNQFADETLAILDKYRSLYPDYDKLHQDTVVELKKRAAFQKAVSHWQKGKNREARALVSPWLSASNKFRLFWLISFLPGSLFNFAARIYFALPANFRQ